MIPNQRSEAGARPRTSEARCAHWPVCAVALVYAGVAVGALGCTGAADVPEVPDLSGLEESYEAPSAEIAEEPEVQAVVGSVPELRNLAAAFRTAGTLIEPLDEASATAEESQGDGIRVRGKIQVQVRCPGTEASPVYDAATNGTLTLNLAVADNSIRSAFWADAVHCIANGRSFGAMIPMEIDGRMEMDIGSDIRLGRGWGRGRLLFSLDGSITVAGVVFQNISARLDDERFEFLVQTARGSVVLFATDSGIGLRARDATWFCSVDSGTCAIL